MGKCQGRARCEVQERRDTEGGKSKDPGSGPAKKHKADDKLKLALSNKLTQALVTQHHLLQNEADELFLQGIPGGSGRTGKLMEPELGRRTLDKLDTFLLPIVLLLQLSLLFYALLFLAQRLLLWMYDFCFNQGLTHGLQSEMLRSSAYAAYLILCLEMLVMYWLQRFTGWILTPVYYLWLALSFWP